MTIKRTRLKSALPDKVTLPTYRLPNQPPDPPAPSSRQNGPPPSTASQAHADSATHTTRTGQRTRPSKRRLRRRATPLDVLQIPLQAGARKVFDLRRFIIVLALTSAVLLMPQPEGLSPEGQRALALFVFTGSILALEPAPLPIAALIVPVGQIALGIDDVTGAFAPFGKPVVFLILGSLFLAEALRKHGLTRRLALYAIVFSGGQFRLLLFGLMLVTGLLSMWVLNTATAAVLIPVAITIAQRVQQPEHAQSALNVLILGIAYSSSIGAIATIMGSGENAIASTQLNFGFVDWMQYGLPVFLVLLPLSWLMLQVAFRLPRIVIDTQPAADEIARLGVLSSYEREILGVLAVSALLWVTGSQIESWLGLPVTLLNSAVVAIGAVAVLSLEEVIDWNDLKGVNWGVFFVIGAGLTLGDALDKTKANAWFADQLQPLLGGLPDSILIGVLVLLAFGLTQFLNNVPLGAILTPILITLGESMGIVPERLVLPTIFAVAFSYTLPAGSARMTLVAVTGTVQRKDIMRAGLIVGIPSACFIWGFFYMMGQWGWI